MSTDIVMGEAFDLAVRELDQLIDRRFSARRTLTVERESAKHWVAELSGNVLYRSPDRNAVVRFALTFASRTAGVEVEYADDEEFSMRVATERTLSNGTTVYPGDRGYDTAAQHAERVPDNVVPILGRAEA